MINLNNFSTASATLDPRMLLDSAQQDQKPIFNKFEEYVCI